MWKTIQLITEGEHMDLDCVEIWFGELNLYYRSYTLAAAVPRGHHRHIGDLGNFSYMYMDIRGQAENQTGTSYIGTKWLCLKVTPAQSVSTWKGTLRTRKKIMRPTDSDTIYA